MRLLKIFLLAFWGLLANKLIAQDELAIQGTDYEYFTETEEIGKGYSIISFYLKNISEFKLLFFNFNINVSSDGFVIVKPLPEEILILDPYRTNKFCTLKVTGDNPPITWQSRRLFPSVGFNKFPEIGKNYVFFYESEVKGDQTIYTYYLKNICDRRMKFYEFSLKNTNEFNIEKGLPRTAVYLWPDSSVNVVRLSVPLNREGPELNWQAIFTNFQPTGDDFCNELIKVFEASGEDDFGSIRGQGDEANGFTSAIKVPGINQAKIINENGKWYFTGQMGGKD